VISCRVDLLCARIDRRAEHGIREGRCAAARDQHGVDGAVERARRRSCSSIGAVRDDTPARLTEPELDRRIAAIAR
jgi:hypothetical protein